MLGRRFWADELVHHWFHTLCARDWWQGSPAVDAELRRRFLPEFRALQGKSPESFLSNPHTALAAVLLFDQIPRNIFRGTAEAFSSDPLARAITHGALDRGFDQALAPTTQLHFLAMPLMHSEQITDHLRGLKLFRTLGTGTFAFARQHHRMIARFGRYPHRNEVLGRRSTDAERKAVAAGFAW